MKIRVIELEDERGVKVNAPFVVCGCCGDVIDADKGQRGIVVRDEWKGDVKVEVFHAGKCDSGAVPWRPLAEWLSHLQRNSGVGQAFFRE
jgi:hypothetical protein